MSDAIATNTARTPRLRVKVTAGDGAAEELAGVYAAEVMQPETFMAATFRIEVAFNAPGAKGLAWWSDQADVTVTVEVAAGQGGTATDWQHLVTGRVDSISVAPPQGALVLEGRDLAALLIGTRVGGTWQNRTASEVVEEIVRQHEGLKARVTPTDDLVSRFYEGNHVMAIPGQFGGAVVSQWDLLTRLAEREGYDLYMDGTTLVFGPRQEDADAFEVVWQPAGTPGEPPQCNVIDLQLERAMLVARTLVVEVHSWHSGQRQGFMRRAQLDAATTVTASPQKLVVHLADLTEDEAQRRADQMLSDWSQHERVISFRLPADPSLTLRRPIRLRGTGSKWDQTYYPSTITFGISAERGFWQDVRAKNVTPDRQRTPPPEAGVGPRGGIYYYTQSGRRQYLPR